MNALDTNNEKEIMEQSAPVLPPHGGRGATFITSDVDNIARPDKGRVAEEGTHEELTAKRGIYYKLVKNQLTGEIK